MKYIALVAGLCAVAFFLLGYLQKKRSSIVAFNLTSRLLYIAQYLLVGAFAGAVLDVVGAISTLVAKKADDPFISKHKKILFIINSLVIIGTGLLLYKNVFSIFLIVGVLLQTDALWFNNEKVIRIVSIVCCPFCFIYNFTSGAYGSCIGDVLALIFLTYSLIRYDILKK